MFKNKFSLNRVLLLCFYLLSNIAPSFITSLPMYMSHGVVDLHKSVEVAQDSFEDTYFQKLLQDERFFDDAYNNNLVITTEINWDFAENGVVFMRLIDFLENKQDGDAAVMLAKLNELFYLLFHRHLSRIDLPKEKQVHLIHALHYLFNFKSEKGFHAFRSNLTRIFIYSMMVEVMGLPYYEKKEVLLFACEDFRSSFEKIAKECGADAEAFVAISCLINDYAAYGMKEPVLKPSSFKKWVTITIVAAVVVGICWYIGKYIGTWDKFKLMVDDLVASATKTFSETLVKNFSEPTAEAMVKKMQENGHELGKSLGDGAAAAFTERGEALGKNLGDGAAASFVERGEALGKNLGDGAAASFVERAPELSGELLEGFVTEAEAKKPTKGRRPNRNLKKLTDIAGRTAGLALGDAIEGAGLRLPVVGALGIATHDERVRADKAAAARNAAEIEGDDESGADDVATLAPKKAAKPPHAKKQPAKKTQPRRKKTSAMPADDEGDPSVPTEDKSAEPRADTAPLGRDDGSSVPQAAKAAYRGGSWNPMNWSLFGKKK